MLNGPLLHPEILRVLARSGHHAKVLIADGNYPALTKRGPRAELVSLQLVPGVPTVAQVFGAVLAAVQVELRELRTRIAQGVSAAPASSVNRPRRAAGWPHCGPGQRHRSRR